MLPPRKRTSLRTAESRAADQSISSAAARPRAVFRHMTPIGVFGHRRKRKILYGSPCKTKKWFRKKNDNATTVSRKKRRRSSDDEEVEIVKHSRKSDPIVQSVEKAALLHGKESYVTMVVVDKSLQMPDLWNRVKIVPKFVPSIPLFCSEARLGDAYGKFKGRSLPGIPTNKFNQFNQKELDDAEKDWPIQAVYDDVNDGMLLAYYEGWTCYYLMSESVSTLEKTAPVPLELSRLRRRFIEARRESAELEMEKRKIARQVAGNPMTPEEEIEEMKTLFVETKAVDSRNPNNVFWSLEDLTYIHSVINDSFNLGPVFYMSLTESGKNKYPEYAYTAVNILQKDVFEEIKKEGINKPFHQLMNGSFPVFEQHGACASKKCICDIRFDKLYLKNNRRVQRLTYTKNGRLDLRKFDTEQQRVLVECSDVCGCSEDCPRRRLQRGQSLPLVVSYENYGFGLRAAADIAAGELVCEYTGELIKIPGQPQSPMREVKMRKEDDKENMDLLQVEFNFEHHPMRHGRNSYPSSTMIATPPSAKEPSTSSGPVESEWKDTSYEAGLAVMSTNVAICALTKGNIARFVNHSCNPNTAFIEVHSRRYESDVLIPRIGVYAIKDIPLGAEITVSYWTVNERKSAKQSGTICRCGESNCCGFLPGKM